MTFVRTLNEVNQRHHPSWIQYKRELQSSELIRHIKSFTRGVCQWRLSASWCASVSVSTTCKTTVRTQGNNTSRCHVLCDVIFVANHTFWCASEFNMRNDVTIDVNNFLGLLCCVRAIIWKASRRHAEIFSCMSRFQRAKIMAYII